MQITVKKIGANLLGLVLPALAQIGTMPLLLKAMGTGVFGSYVLFLSVASALTFLDLTMSSAVVRLGAICFHERKLQELGATVAAALLVVVAAASTIFIGVACAGAWVIREFVEIRYIQPDTYSLLLGVTATVTLGMLGNVLSATLKSIDQFEPASMFVALVAIATYAVPGLAMWTLHEGASRAMWQGAVAVAAVIALQAMYVLGRLRAIGVERRELRPNRAVLAQLTGFGGTLTVHTMIGLAFTHGQRIIVGYSFGAAAVAAYHATFTLISKVHAVINAGTEILFPVASVANGSTVRQLYKRGMAASFFMVLAPLLVLALSAHFIFTRWLGAGVASEAAAITPLLCLAFFFVGLSAIPFHILNGKNRSRVNVIYSVSNLFLYLIITGAFWLTGHLNILSYCGAYAASNVITGCLFQAYSFRFIQQLP